MKSYIHFNRAFCEFAAKLPEDVTSGEVKQ
jgi:hypothetical protein